MPPDTLLDATAIALDSSASAERMARLLLDCYQRAHTISRSDAYSEATRDEARALLAEMEELAPAVKAYRVAVVAVAVALTTSNRRLSGEREAPVGATTEA